ncbi:MAG: zinc-ribbon domain-containing protein [Chitinivibrionia bacterium]|nr:zinc-ribbon domain-containing protein [Chitinivibrionia bacterium]
MIIQCQGCAAKYFLASDKVPRKPAKVRCPKCKAVFRLQPPAAVNENLVATAGEQVISSSTRFSDSESPHAAKAAGVSVQEKAISGAKLRSSKERKEDRAKRLARVLVSDILWYNKEKRDQALVDGNLMTVMGEEIKKSWELYKEKIGPEMANSTGYFKEALNEILADGQKIF